MENKFPCLAKLFSLAFNVFPGPSYWSDVFNKRIEALKDGGMEHPNLSLIADIFQSLHKPNKEKKITQVMFFCTVPKDSACWDTVLGSYVLLMAEMGTPTTPSFLASVLLGFLKSREESALFDPENIEGFGNCCMEYLAQVKEGRPLKIFTDPEGVFLRIIDFQEDLLLSYEGIPKGTSFEKTKASISENLNKPHIKELIQKELNLLNKND